MEAWMYCVLFLGFYALLRLAVVLFSLVTKDYRQSYLTQQGSELSDIFIAISPDQILIFSLILGGILGGGCYGFSRSVALSLLVGAAIPLSSRYVVSYLTTRRHQRFEEQFPDALAMISASMRAGLAPSNAIAKAAEETTAPMSQELGMLHKELLLGKRQEAYEGLARRIPLECVQLFSTAVITCQKMGGDLASMGDKISDTIRKNIELRRELRTLTAEGKMQGIIMGAMPFIMGGVLFFISPDMMMPLITTTIGHILIGIVLAMELAGAFLINDILKIEE